MPLVIECPQCKRRLNVPDDLLGRRVKCPSCATEFEAVESVIPIDEGSESVAPEVRPPAPAPNPFAYDEPQPRYPGGPEEGYSIAPHRGAIILTLGIVGLCMSCCPLTGWILGGIAMSMGNTDLYEMARNRMDRSGRGMTQAGKICGTIAVVIATVGAVLRCLGLMVQMGNHR